jgi:hypothetical protein
VSCSARSHRRSESITGPGSVPWHPYSTEDTLTLDEAIRDLLDISADIMAVAVVDASGAVVASGPAAAGAPAGEAVARLWEAAARRAGQAGAAELEHIVVPVGTGVVAAVRAFDHRAVAVTGPRPAVALLLFDLRACLGDALANTEEAG